MSTPRVFTRGPGVTLLENEQQHRDFDWDRRMIVLEGEWSSEAAAVQAFRNRPVSVSPSVWWPESVTAKASGGGLIRVTIECAGLIDGEEKWYQVTEDNAEMRQYQLSDVEIFSPTYGWTPTGTYARANLEMGIPKLGWIGFSRVKPDVGLNGHPVATPIRGTFPRITPPPWRVTGVDGTANFPGGWRQMAAPYKQLGGFNNTGAPLLTPAYYRGEWLYNYTEKLTL